MSLRVGVVLVSHGRSAVDLLDAATQMGNQLPQISAVPTEFQEKAEHIQARVEDAIAAVDTGAGVLLIVDLCGSTPANVCAGIVRATTRLPASHPLDILYGLSLPMLAKLETADREHGPTRLGLEIQDSARRNIRLSSELLGPRQDK